MAGFKTIKVRSNELVDFIGDVLDVPSVEEILERPNDVLVVHDLRRIHEVFKGAYYNYQYLGATFHPRDYSIIDLKKLEKNDEEKVLLLFTSTQDLIKKNILDFTYEELVGLYQHRIIIVSGEEYFYKYETMLRIVNGMKP